MTLVTMNFMNWESGWKTAKRILMVGALVGVLPLAHLGDKYRARLNVQERAGKKEKKDAPIGILKGADPCVSNTGIEFTLYGTRVPLFPGQHELPRRKGNLVLPPPLAKVHIEAHDMGRGKYTLKFRHRNVTEEMEIGRCRK